MTAADFIKAKEQKAAREHFVARCRGEREVARYAEAVRLASESIKILIGGNRDVLRSATVELEKAYQNLFIEYDKLLPIYAAEEKKNAQ